MPNIEITLEARRQRIEQELYFAEEQPLESLLEDCITDPIGMNEIFNFIEAN